MNKNHYFYSMRVLLIMMLFLLPLSVSGQEGQYLIQDDKRATKVDFELFNNLIILPVEVNGVELKFLLDSGVDKTILFSFEEVDSLMLKNSAYIKVKGLEGKESYSAYRSRGNQVRIKDVINPKADIYVVFDQENYLTSSIGTVINGVIGYDLLKDLILRINYQQKNLKFYTPSRFKRPLWFFNEHAISLINNKPHIQASYIDEELGMEQGNFLIDVGSSDAVWLYKKEDMKLPSNKFRDNLGFGFRGIITGYRSKVDRFELGDYIFEKANVSFPDLDELMSYRVGSIGNNILRRFRIFLNYPENRVYLKSNSSLNDDFKYDKSGLLLRYDGLSIIEKKIPVKVSVRTSGNKDYSSADKQENLKTIYEIKKKVKVAEVRKGSPAQQAGIISKDIIVRLQGKTINSYDLKEIRKMLSSEEGRSINMKINREGKLLDVEFKLKDRLR